LPDRRPCIAPAARPLSMTPPVMAAGHILAIP
jgi:hypothetical protein